MGSVQQTVTAHIHPVVGAVVAQYLCVCRAPSLGEVPERVHQQVVAKRRPLQMGLEVRGTQRHFTPQAGLDSRRGLSFIRGGRAAVTRHFTVLLLTLGAGKATFALALSAPGLADAGGTEAVSTGQGVGLTEEVSAHRAGELLLHGRHGERMKGLWCVCECVSHNASK